MALPSNDILTNLMSVFQSKLAPASNIILPYAKNTLYLLTVIDLCVAYVMALIKEEEAGYKLFLVNALKYGAFIYLVTSYNSIINMIIQSFQLIGLKAAGNIISISEFTNPSIITTKGLELTADFLANVGAGQTVMNPITAIIVLIAAIAIIVAFMVMGIQLFVVTVEFYIVAALGLILVPFGVFKHTSFLFDKIKDGIINFGIKYMVLGFVMSVSMDIIKKWSALSGDATIQQATYMAFGACALAYLCYHAPSVASGMASGGGGTLGGMAMMGGIAGAMGTAKRSIGNAHDGVRGTRQTDPKTGETKRHGGLIGHGGSFDSIRGTMSPDGVRVGGLTGEGGFVDDITGMGDIHQQQKIAAKAAERQEMTDKAMHNFMTSPAGNDVVSKSLNLSGVTASSAAASFNDQSSYVDQNQANSIEQGNNVLQNEPQPSVANEMTAESSVNPINSNNQNQSNRPSSNKKTKGSQQQKNINTGQQTEINRVSNNEKATELKQTNKNEYKRGVEGQYE